AAVRDRAHEEEALPHGDDDPLDAGAVDGLVRGPGQAGAAGDDGAQLLPGLVVERARPRQEHAVGGHRDRVVDAGRLLDEGVEQPVEVAGVLGGHPRSPVRHPSSPSVPGPCAARLRSTPAERSERNRRSPSAPVATDDGPPAPCGAAGATARAVGPRRAAPGTRRTRPLGVRSGTPPAAAPVATGAAGTGWCPTGSWTGAAGAPGRAGAPAAVGPPTPAGRATAASTSARIAGGGVTCAVIPATTSPVSRTPMPWRAARTATTRGPRCLADVVANGSAPARRRLARSSSSAAMPSPWSTTTTS